MDDVDARRQVPSTFKACVVGIGDGIDESPVVLFILFIPPSSSFGLGIRKDTTRAWFPLLRVRCRSVHVVFLTIVVIVAAVVAVDACCCLFSDVFSPLNKLKMPGI